MIFIMRRLILMPDSLPVFFSLRFLIKPRHNGKEILDATARGTNVATASLNTDNIGITANFENQNSV